MQLSLWEALLLLPGFGMKRDQEREWLGLRGISQRPLAKRMYFSQKLDSTLQS